MAKMFTRTRHHVTWSNTLLAIFRRNLLPHLEGGWNQCVSFLTLRTLGLSFAAPVFVKLIGNGTTEFRREIHLHK
jgi:hypothetical protein